ncbi:hypothetical protein CMQ_7218 [Grosmannia clavigera kw1407]|uniref:Uncharacterized protein n=1 Tax=Grosmannia clavigera (strain kw1407 / UAMH 11150) TaxID=655863 RepID=F0XQ65_GROCL|nr:uncharacterized protein CMQ_7218 [Grosmannia clavigera kw1407]EFX00216.1 hypothetical protein CMQ_7218 [Grosmannia clavigera kw1407]
MPAEVLRTSRDGVCTRTHASSHTSCSMQVFECFSIVGSLWPASGATRHRPLRLACQPTYGVLRSMYRARTWSSLLASTRFALYRDRGRTNLSSGPGPNTSCSRAPLSIGCVPQDACPAVISLACRRSWLGTGCSTMYDLPNKCIVPPGRETKGKMRHPTSITEASSPGFYTAGPPTPPLSLAAGDWEPASLPEQLATQVSVCHNISYKYGGTGP